MLILQGHVSNASAHFLITFVQWDHVHPSPIKLKLYMCSSSNNCSCLEMKRPYRQTANTQCKILAVSQL